MREAGELGKLRSKMNGKLWRDLTEEEHQKFPADYEAQTGQGEITLHSEEHFGAADKGIAFLRRFMEQQLKAIAEGRDPAGVAFNDQDATVRLEAGQELLDAARAA